MHDGYYLPKVIQRVCKACKKEARLIEKQDPNLFAESVRVPELVSELDVIADKKAQEESQQQVVWTEQILQNKPKNKNKKKRGGRSA